MLGTNEKIVAYFVYRHSDKRIMSNEIKGLMAATKACNAFNAASRYLCKVGKVIEKESGEKINRFED